MNLCLRAFARTGTANGTLRRSNCPQEIQFAGWRGCSPAQNAGEFPIGKPRRTEPRCGFRVPVSSSAKTPIATAQEFVREFLLWALFPCETDANSGTVACFLSEFSRIPLPSCPTEAREPAICG